MAREPQGQVSADLDMLTCDLIGEALDVLAAGPLEGVVATVLDDDRTRFTCSFEEDSPEECLDGARQWVADLGRGAKKQDGVGAPRCYALAYQGAVDLGSGYADALIVEFGERGNQTDYSAHLELQGIGRGDRLRWTDPAPAGELDPLL
ncbi:hypothetical protein QJ043_04005 [Olsenella sp. YH-ols2217]|uniref:Uncharacterized protein n=1 Tax=Kribbibacterium absianum TaxID=3044210 RepID=A0ABT6ZJL5_9ACTN|nr:MULTISPECIES: hypothetical protein [unclassified Olsenella]MDJ1122774.1 hypothetical protein [Olsenella sp. YH-ols2216]MDJ1129243.1 hypothetical protein [Olsenella sp. YH-ols2217]